MMVMMSTVGDAKFMPIQYEEGELWFSPIKHKLGWERIFESGKTVVEMTIIALVSGCKWYNACSR